MKNTNETIVSACPLNCWDACSFSVKVENGKVGKITGNKTHPITDGKICSRGRLLEERTNSNQRITTPLKKIGGEWQHISWDQALQEIASKLVEVKQLYGPTAVLHSHDYSNNGLLKNIDERFFRAFGGWTKVEGSLCWGAGIEAQIRDFGNSYAHAPKDILNSRHIIIWGRNVARTNMHLFSFIKAAKEKGATVTVIDPMKNQMEKIADHFVTVRPGSDGLLAASIMKLMLKKDWQDKEFIEKATHGFEKLIDELDTVSIDDAVAYTGVSEDIMMKLARMYTDGPTTTFLGLGMQRYKNGGNTIRLIDALGAISGNVGKAGGGVNYALLPVGQAFDTDKLALRDKEASIRTFTRMNQGEKIRTEKDPAIKVIFVSRGNPLTQLPNTNVAKEAFKKVDTIIVMDQYMTDTAETADYFLPSTTVFEEEDIYYASMYHSYVNYGPKIVEPPREAKSDLWVWTELAKRLGFGEYFDYSIDGWLEMGTIRMRENGMNLDLLKKEGFYKIPVDDIPWKDHVFQTPTGKYEFYSEKAKREGKLGEIQIVHSNELLEEENRERYPYHLLSLHPLRSNHSQHFPLFSSGEFNTVEISSNIAKIHQLTDGDRVNIKNEVGELKAVVRIEVGLHEDTMNIDEGRWQKNGGSVNMLTPNGESDMGQGSTLYDCFVTIERIDN